MEQQSKWKKVLSRGTFVIVCILAALLLLVGAIFVTLRVQQCARGPQTEETPQPTDTPAPTPLPDRLYSADRHAEQAPPLDRLDIDESYYEDYGEGLGDPTHWIDLTPEGAEDFTVLRNIDLGCTYVCEDDTYYRLDEGTDGKGVVDLLLTDLDLDDEPDLLYTYHYGANEDAMSKVGWFRFSTHEAELSAFSLRDGFLSLVEEDGNYILYRAERNADLDTGTFGLTLTQRLGEITEFMGGVALILE